MTPLRLAESFARDPETAALGVAMIARSLSDHDPSDPLRQPWPLNAATVEAAAQYLGVTPTADLIAEALTLAPTVSDAMLNRRPA